MIGDDNLVRQNQAVTIKEVARRASVSEATVSRALNDSPLVKQATKTRILKLTQKIGYRPNALARSVRTQKTKTIGVIISNIVNAFFTEVIRAIEDQASLMHYSVIIINTDERPENETEAIKMLNSYMVTGFIIASVGGVGNYKNLLGTVPTVFIDRIPSVAMAADSKYDVILSDNQTGAKIVVQEMLKQGAKKIGIISSGVSTAGLERLAGYKLALEEQQITINEALIHFSDVQMKETRAMTQDLLNQQHCDGIFAADNTILLSVLQELRAQSFPPIKVGSFDNTQWFDFFWQPVISIQQPTAQIGAQAVQRLINRIKQPNLQSHVIRLAGKLVERK